MSATAVRESKAARRACHHCRERKARFQHAGTVKADRTHTLCFECFRAARDRRRAQLLADVPVPSPLRRSDGPGASAARRLDRRSAEHRRRMLAHLQRLARR